MNRIAISALSLIVLVVSLSTLGCGILKDAAEKVIEDEAGCTAEQLGTLDEPDLPNCSKAVACCKFIKGECGEIKLFAAPDEVIQACNINETVLAEVIGEYQGLTEGDCPPYLTDEACQDGLAKTRENYARAVDLGDLSVASNNAPSCQLIVDETVNRLNDKLGTAASLLPEACEPVVVNLPNPGADDITPEETVSADE